MAGAAGASTPVPVPGVAVGGASSDACSSPAAVTGPATSFFFSSGGFTSSFTSSFGLITGGVNLTVGLAGAGGAGGGGGGLGLLGSIGGGSARVTCFMEITSFLGSFALNIVAKTGPAAIRPA